MKVVLLLISILVIQVSAEFTRDDFEACYDSCRVGFKTQIKAASGDGQQGNYYNKMLDQEQCILGITEADYKAYYGIATVTDSSKKQDGYCKYFYSSSLYDASEINQDQLKTLAQTCFQTNCQFTAETDLTPNDGNTHYTQTYNNCIQSCVDQTANDAQKIYEQDVNSCYFTYASSGASAVENEADYKAAWVTYDNCIKSNRYCGQLAFLTFANYNYKSTWGKCYDSCISTFKSTADAADAGKKALKEREAFLTCVQSAKIPDASSYTRLDNSVDVGSQIMFVSTILLAILSIILI